MQIRPRLESDIPTLVALADAVRRVDRWPPHRVGSAPSFLFSEVAVVALVAEDEGRVVGHVAVHEKSADKVMKLAADTLGLETGDLAVVARLFVDPERRGQGVGLRLLDTAVEAAILAHWHPILDVWTELGDAIALYDRARWQRVGEVTFTFAQPCGPDCLHTGSSLDSFVYAAPAPPDPSPARRD